ncbi:hypothetical protein CUMW_288090 [Citrus unshiu]|uniref:Uncharacterized protein n=1 Tax=Citrus unshiu TaxID=55188 RepID=A0A2H5MY24_CITUN|nr:hypothetical protein CUMW_288090 [Citrus unshiu]
MTVPCVTVFYLETYNDGFVVRNSLSHSKHTKDFDKLRENEETHDKPTTNHNHSKSFSLPTILAAIFDVVRLPFSLIRRSSSAETCFCQRFHPFV